MPVVPDERHHVLPHFVIIGVEDVRPAPLEADTVDEAGACVAADLIPCLIDDGVPAVALEHVRRAAASQARADYNDPSVHFMISVLRLVSSCSRLHTPARRAST